MKAVTTLEELDALDESLIVAGYRAGMEWEQVNYTQRDQAYWHGYLNGQVDLGKAPMSPEQEQLARAYVEKARA